MTTTFEQLKTRTDADARTARETYSLLLSKSAGGKTLTKIEANRLHAVCQQLDITPEQASQDEATLRRVAELSAACTGWDARMQELLDEQNEIGNRWSTDAESESRMKLIRDFGQGREVLAKIGRDQMDIARQRNELEQLQQNPRLFEVEQPSAPEPCVAAPKQPARVTRKPGSLKTAAEVAHAGTGWE